MRDDFNKLLTERERRGSSSCYREVRHSKAYQERWDEVGGRESMKARYDSYDDRKSFSENLNPLISFLRGQVNRPWDKIYSELTKAFDKRKVINDHILIHLFDFVETKDVYLDDGELWVRSAYKAPVRLKEYSVGYASPHYYVDPRDGIMKQFKQKTYRQIRKEQTKQAEKAEADKYRKLPDGSELHKIDGVWFHFEFAKVPTPIYQYICGTNMPQYTFRNLSQEEREKCGIKVQVNKVKCALTGETITKTNTQYAFGGKYVYNRSTTLVVIDGKYRATKKTASKKLLRQAGL